jgi:hypothetical protein
MAATSAASMLAVLALILVCNARTTRAESAVNQPPFVERWQSTPAPATPKSDAGKPQSTDPPQVSVDQALYLIRSTLLTLNDANRSGNYSVLRDLAAPDFQAANSAADLALSFSDLRRRNFDLFAAAVAAPQLTAAPALDAKKMLRLTGFFPTRPLQINFDLLFQNVGGQWRTFGISVATPQAPAQIAAKPVQDLTSNAQRQDGGKTIR